MAIGIRPTAAVNAAADSIRRILENDPREVGYPLLEGLFYLDEESLRTLFHIDDDALLVEVTDVRIL